MRIPDIGATIAEGGYSNIRPPLALDVCSDPTTWPRPEAEGGSTTLWDAVICSNMIHIAPLVRECTVCTRKRIEKERETPNNYFELYSKDDGRRANELRE